jgi:hypothetical protein
MLFNYSTDPNFADLLNGIITVVKYNYDPNRKLKDFITPSNFFEALNTYCLISQHDCMNVLYCAVIFTIIRYLFDSLISKV